MDTNERRENTQTLLDKNAQINVVLNQPASDDNDIEINLIRIFDRMKFTKRLYAWILLLCIVVGICAPLLIYQFTNPPLSVSSVATLDYNVDGSAVKGLTAPDGTALDLTQILSSYVLQNAMDGLHLSTPITISNLRSNIKIERVLTESSRREQEIAAQMREDKNNDAFDLMQNVSLTYDNKFIVSLTNGFGDEDSKKKIFLLDSELRLLLNRIMESYNDYLVQTYPNLKLPDDTFGVIDAERMDILECLDQLRSASDELYSYVESLPSNIRTYRSWNTGKNLNDLIQILRTYREVDINYLYSYVYINSIAKDKQNLLLKYEYQHRNAQNSMDALNKNIDTVASILKNYKNDEIVVAREESDSSKITSTPTDYFNRLVMQQVSNYKQATNIQIRIEELDEKIEKLSSPNSPSFYELESKDRITYELNRAVDNCRHIYSQIKAQMEEIQTNPLYTSYIESTNAAGEEEGFLSKNIKNIIIGTIAGVLIGCGIWFLSALFPEFKQSNSKKENGKEVAA